ncbi:transcriptional regulator [Azospirillum sp. INR13]|nr:transcriptional regulator [Azospirillum sp. INR13]
MPVVIITRLLQEEFATEPKVGPDAITCLECSKRNRILKRHLGREHDLTPDEYRAKGGLSGDYPMTAPNYAAQRSELAKAHRLGRLRSVQPDSERNELPVEVAPQLNAQGARLTLAQGIDDGQCWLRIPDGAPAPLSPWLRADTRRR